MISKLALARCVGVIGSAIFLLAGLSCIALSDVSRINKLKTTQTLLSIREAEKAFKAKHGKYGTLQDPTSAGLLDQALANGSKDGYKFEVTPSENNYKALATPQRFKSLARGHIT